ncbi:hypothetical protein ABB07_22145 [Streptomyces incarnatus]|uniref:Uncharacterized protein n=1 Tax=Streptomyces incarnatus TaxID=665007 RepID=A0ABN4GGE8_9ACTN|nr:hypothetical protein [Streptomyces incarnatus]AKJ12630.1 hypothetical protein ABB07_22145 [Streptomyces incarnatus]
MRVRRALAIVIATPVLLATIGVTGASAAPPPQPTSDGPSARHHHAADSRGGTAAKSPDQAEPEEGILGTLTGEILGRMSPGGETE